MLRYALEKNVFKWGPSITNNAELNTLSANVVSLNKDIITALQSKITPVEFWVTFKRVDADDESASYNKKLKRIFDQLEQIAMLEE